MASCFPRAFGRLTLRDAHDLSVSLLGAFQTALGGGGLWGGRGEAISLSQRMRGHDLTHGPQLPQHHTHGHVPVSPHAAPPPSGASSASGKVPPAGKAAHKAPPPPPPLTAAQKAKIERENEIWKTEQAMKAKLDKSDEAKGNRLWQQTVAVVHKHDPNAALIAKLNKV